MKIYSKVSIPQAVGTIAMKRFNFSNNQCRSCFNTASGRYYCNHMVWDHESSRDSAVSIPQAVGTIAMN